MRSPYFLEEHHMFRESVSGFLTKEIVPKLDEWEKEEKIPRIAWKKLAEQDLLGLNYPEEFGGINADFFFSVVFLEELARLTNGGFTASVAVHEYMAMSYIYHYGNDHLKEKYLISGIQGEKIGALAVTEPDAGSDVANIRTRAVREGEHYVLNGSKTFITNGVYGDFLVVAAKTGSGEGSENISLFVVDNQSTGVFSRKLKKIGWNCSDTAELTFENVRMPVTHLIGHEGMGFYYLMEMFQLERLVAAITAMAGAQGCLDSTLNYISQREAFGKPLSRFQTIRHQLADLATELEAARQLTYYAAWLYQEKAPAIRECSMSKLYTTELAKRVADTCLQFFGGYGYMEEYPISRMYRDARVGTIVGGTSEIMREIISKIMIDQHQYQHPTSPEEQEVEPETSVEAEPQRDADAPHPLEEEPQPLEMIEGKNEPPAQSPPDVEETSQNTREDLVSQEDSPEENENEQKELEEILRQLVDKEEFAPPSGTLLNELEESSQAEEEPLSIFEEESNHETSAETTGNDEPLNVDKIFQTLPSRFRASKAADYQTVIHFKITGEEQANYTVKVGNGTCEVIKGYVGEANCIVETNDKTFMEIESGKLNAQIAFMMGKVKISNVPEMLQFTQLFDPLPDT
ncbi:MAG: hypothetical protein D6748_05125 [Calditrichaeota bacterium]|nr:MAG: hypothetical protein D6748_05125 [Calditrichota bacterium]